MLKATMAFAALAALFAQTQTVRAQEVMPMPGGVGIIQVPGVTSDTTFTRTGPRPTIRWTAPIRGKTPYLASGVLREKPFSVCRGAGSDDHYIGKVVADEKRNLLCAFVNGDKRAVTVTATFEAIAPDGFTSQNFDQNGAVWVHQESPQISSAVITSQLKSGQIIALCRASQQDARTNEMHPGWTTGDVCNVAFPTGPMRLTPFDTVVVRSNLIQAPKPTAPTAPPPPSYPMTFSEMWVQR